MVSGALNVSLTVSYRNGYTVYDNNNSNKRPFTKSRCEVPMRFTPGWHSGDAGVCLWAVHGATELRVFTVVAFCATWNGGGVL